MLLPTATIELVYMDEKGSTAAVVVNVPITSSIATMDATATALASLIAPITDCVLVKIRYSYRAKFVVDASDAGVAPVVVSGVFIFNTTSDDPLSLIAVPAIKESLLVDIGPTAGYGIDTTLSDVSAFIDELFSIGATNPYGDAISSINAAYRQSRV